MEKIIIFKNIQLLIKIFNILFNVQAPNLEDVGGDAKRTKGITQCTVS